MKKEELIEKLKEAFENPNDLANMEPNIPDDFEFSEEVEKAKLKKNQLYNELINHPYYKNSKLVDQKDSYNIIYNKYRDTPSEKTQKDKEYFEFIGIGEIEIMEDIRNSDEVYCVIYFPKHNIYLQLDGEYNSYESVSEWEDWDFTEVFPQKKEIIIYNTINQ